MHFQLQFIFVNNAVVSEKFKHAISKTFGKREKTDRNVRVVALYACVYRPCALSGAVVAVVAVVAAAAADVY